MRDGVVVRATTLRVPVSRFVVRATTLRDVPVPERVVATVALLVARETTLRDADVFARDALFVVVRTRDAAVERAFVRGDAARGDEAAPVGTTVGAIGSAKTARIDKNVEHTKNAPASKNTVPTAFLATPTIFCLFIHYSPADTFPKIRPFSRTPNGAL